MIFDSTTSAVLPLIGVGLGWLLSELGLYLRDRRANKKVFGQAILQLLEIREAVQFKRRVATLAKAYAKQGHVDRAASLREAKPESLNDCLAALSSIKKEISSISPSRRLCKSNARKG